MIGPCEACGIATTGGNPDCMHCGGARFSAVVPIPREAIGPHTHRWQTAPSDVQRHCSECFLDQTRLGILYDWPMHDPVCLVRRDGPAGAPCTCGRPVPTGGGPYGCGPGPKSPLDVIRHTCACGVIWAITISGRTKVSEPGDGKTYAGGAMSPIYCMDCGKSPATRFVGAIARCSACPAAPAGPVQANGVQVHITTTNPVEQVERLVKQAADAVRRADLDGWKRAAEENGLRANALADRCQTLEDENRELLAENAELRRKVDRLERKR